MKTNKRVLIVTYYWPPTGGSGVQRWVKFVKYLHEFGWQPVVYTPENPEQLAIDETLLAEIPSDVELIKRPILEPYNIYRKLLGGKKAKAASSESPSGEINPINASSNKSTVQKFALWVRSNLFIPDPRVSWVRPSVRFLKKYLKEHPVDVIVTTGPPQSMHLIGRGLKRACGIRWIADFRDPWTNMFFFKHLNLCHWAEKLHHKLEQSVLDESDAIISVTPLVQKDFEEMTRTPVHLITNGFDDDDFSESGSYAQKVPQPERFTIAHTGLFAADGNPVALWELLSRKCEADAEFAANLDIRLVGKVDREIIASIREHGLGDRLELLGYLPHSETVREQRSAAMLILPLRVDPEYAKVLPGKIFEYLASRRPILGIGQEEGAAAQVLAQTGSGTMCDWGNASAMSAFIDVEWERFKSGKSGRPDADIRQYSRRELTKTLAKLLDEG